MLVYLHFLFLVLDKCKFMLYDFIVLVSLKFLKNFDPSDIFTRKKFFYQEICTIKSYLLGATILPKKICKA